jgi:FkbM family methyltransferase
MTFISIIRKLLRRKFFYGQDRIFNFLFKKKLLNRGILKAKPINGDFIMECDTTTWIGAKIFYLGDYEPELKLAFKTIIKKGDTILDIGANVGFHSLYFAELAGKNGKVLAFEPVPYNFDVLNTNIKLNSYENINVKNIALGNKNEQLLIDADENSENPGSFNLFANNGQVAIKCAIGDEVIKEKVDFIKIDVEGYEAFVINGLINTIETYKPNIVFEYDVNYIQKTGLPKNYIVDLLSPLGYSFHLITRQGMTQLPFEKIKSGNLFAKPN